MPNLEFAIWGGDLGSAVAAKVHDKQDRGVRTQEWSRYFSGSNNTLACDSDLNGDIHAYVIGRGITGVSCKAIPKTKVTTILMRVSQILYEYYEQTTTPLGTQGGGRNHIRSSIWQCSRCGRLRLAAQQRHNAR